MDSIPSKSDSLSDHLKCLKSIQLLGEIHGPMWKNTFTIVKLRLGQILLLANNKGVDLINSVLILCILKGEMPFKMHKNIYFFPENNIYVCIPYLKFSPVIPESFPKTHLFFLLA